MTRKTLTAQELDRKARRIRATCVKMAHEGRRGHLSSSLSYVDVLTAIFHNWLDYSGEAGPRDRFILSKGHGCTSLYAVLADLGMFPPERLAEYAVEGSPFPDHPCRHALGLLECSSGSLGLGLGMAAGIAYGARLRGGPAPKIAVLMGDGECNEGSVWEAAMFAAAQGLSNILAVVDYNGIQAVGRSDEIMGGADLAGKFRSFGWGAATIDGGDMGEICAALGRFPLEKGRPSAIVAKTRMKISFMEDDVLWHYRCPSREELDRALAELGESPIY